MKTTILFLLPALVLAACVTPINTGFESARMLNKGGLEILGHYSHYSIADAGETNAANNNFGLRLGYGLSDQFDLKVRYERLVPVEEGGGGVNYVDLAPKVQIMKNWIAGTLPIGLYFAEGDTRYVISPRMLFTFPANNNFDATLAAKADIFPQDESNVYLGFQLGVGISSNLQRWALRPELGLMIDPGESGQLWSWGIGLTTTIPTRR